MRSFTSQRLHQRQHAPFSSPHQGASAQPVHISTPRISNQPNCSGDLLSSPHSSRTTSSIRSSSNSSSSKGTDDSSSSPAWLPALPWQQLTAGALAATQAVAAVAALQLSAAPPSWAVLNSPNARIPRTADAALRRWVCFRGEEEEGGEQGRRMVRVALAKAACLCRVVEVKPLHLLPTLHPAFHHTSHDMPRCLATDSVPHPTTLTPTCTHIASVTTAGLSLPPR